MKQKYNEKHEAVPYAVATARVLTFLKAQPIGVDRLPIPAAASSVAGVIWPGHTMESQGAGGAASRVLHKMKRGGLVRWHHSPGGSWGWIVIR